MATLTDMIIDMFHLLKLIILFQLPECDIVKKKKLELNIQVMGDNEEVRGILLVLKHNIEH